MCSHRSCRVSRPRGYLRPSTPCSRRLRTRGRQCLFARAVGQGSSISGRRVLLSEGCRRYAPRAGRGFPLSQPLVSSPSPGPPVDCFPCIVPTITRTRPTGKASEDRPASVSRHVGAVRPGVFECSGHHVSRSNPRKLVWQGRYHMTQLFRPCICIGECLPYAMVFRP